MGQPEPVQCRCRQRNLDSAPSPLPGGSFWLREVKPGHACGCWRGESGLGLGLASRLEWGLTGSGPALGLLTRSRQCPAQGLGHATHTSRSTGHCAGVDVPCRACPARSGGAPRVPTATLTTPPGCRALQLLVSRAEFGIWAPVSSCGECLQTATGCWSPHGEGTSGLAPFWVTLQGRT